MKKMMALDSSLRESDYEPETKGEIEEMVSMHSPRAPGHVHDTKRLRYEIGRLSKAISASEVRISLRRVLASMENADSASRTAVRNALDRAVPDTKNREKRSGWTRENRAFFVSMLLTFYKGDRLSLLPREVVCGTVFSYFPPKHLATLASVSRGFRNLSDSDASWQSAYDRAFGHSKAGVTYDYGASLKESYHQRIRDPTCGDRVEVAWQGRFRLEGLEVYRGLAWWAAEVAEKRDSDHDTNLATQEEDMRPPQLPHANNANNANNDDNIQADNALAQNQDQNIDEMIPPEAEGVGGGEEDEEENGADGNHQAEEPAANATNTDQNQNEQGAATTNPINQPPLPNSAASSERSHQISKRYKVHYLNWDSRWDEWVSREQLRWPVQEGKNCAIDPGDDVEVWCSGNTVPGAWLRAVVEQVDDDLFCVGNVASSGHLWVSRDRVRLVRRKADRIHDTAQEEATNSIRRNGRVPSCLAAPLHRLRDLWTRSPSVASLSCVFAPFHHRRSNSPSAQQMRQRNTAPPRTQQPATVIIEEENDDEANAGGAATL